MDSKIMQIFYGNDCLPYKDKERTIHYPVIGNSFTGANNTTQLRFYVRDIGGTIGVSWVAVSKLPNGQIGNKVLSNPTYDAEVGEFYLALDLSSYYTSIKGEVYISLNGYQGGVLFEQDPDTGIYEISGTPTIQATGVVKIAINYAPQIIEGTHFEEDDLQQILGLVAEKLNIRDGIVVYGTGSDLSELSDGQLLFNIETGEFYIIDNNAPTRYTLVYSKSDIDALLSQKVDKTNQASKLYGTDSDGNQAIIPVEDETGDVARRDNSGQLVVPINPSANGNATSKQYVDAFAKSLVVSIDSSTYVLTLQLRDKNNNVLSTQTVDLPLEQVIVSGRYDEATESIILVLHNGTEVSIPVSDLVDGLVSDSDLATILADYYTKSQTDALLSQKANTSGNYPLLNVGKAEIAENLTPYGENSGVSSDKPFVFQSSGGDSEISNNALFRKLIGKTYRFYNDAAISQVNGFSGTQSFNSTTGYITLNGSFTAEGNKGLDGSSPRKAHVIEGHKYLRKIRVNGTISEELKIRFAYVEALSYTLPAGTYTDQDIELPIVVANWTNTNEIAFGAMTTTQVFTDFSIRIQLFDLTEIFGEGNEPSVDQFNNLFPQPYYSYGVSLVSSKSSSYKVIGFNACEGMEQGSLNESGAETTSTFSIRTKGYIRIVKGLSYKVDFINKENYTFANGVYVFEYDINKTFIKRTWISSSQVGPNGWARNTILPNDNSFTGFDPNTHFIRVIFNNYPNNLTYDGNEKVVIYIYWDESRLGYYEEYVSHTYTLPNIELRSVGSTYDEIDYEGNFIQRIGARAYQSGDETDNSVITDGTTTYYVLNAPVLTSVSTWSLSTDIDNWGTQEFIGNGYPQGNDFFYPVDYKAFVDSLGGREDVNWDAAELVSKTELQDAISDIEIPTGNFGFPLISAPSSTTLTDAEILSITSGCQIDGNFLNLIKPTFYPARLLGGGAIYRGLVIGFGVSGSQTVRLYEINTGTKVIANSGTKQIDLVNVDTFNGKSIPNYPSNTGTFNIKQINGALTWVDNQTQIGVGTFSNGQFTLASSLFSDGLYFFTYGNCSGFAVITSTMITNSTQSPIRIAMPVIYDVDGSARAGILGIQLSGTDLVFSLVDNTGAPVVDGYQMTIVKTGLM